MQTSEERPPRAEQHTAGGIEQVAELHEGLMLLEVRGLCTDCGWNYPAYRGHLEACPRCALARARRLLASLTTILESAPENVFAGAEALACLRRAETR